MSANHLLEKELDKRFKDVNQKIKTSFALIRKDMNDMSITLDAMRTYLKKEKRNLDYARKQDNKIREEFRKDVEEFTQKIAQLKIALSEVRTIQRDSVLIKDLAKIEDRIKTSFKNEIDSYKEQIKDLKKDLREADRRLAALESGKVREKKKSFFGFGKKEE